VAAVNPPVKPGGPDPGGAVVPGGACLRLKTRLGKREKVPWLGVFVGQG
jgi:hypothetical protein